MHFLEDLQYLIEWRHALLGFNLLDKLVDERSTDAPSVCGEENVCSVKEAQVAQ